MYKAYIQPETLGRVFCLYSVLTGRVGVTVARRGSSHFRNTILINAVVTSLKSGGRRLRMMKSKR
jgi:hypothetical protein